MLNMKRFRNSSIRLPFLVWLSSVSFGLLLILWSLYPAFVETKKMLNKIRCEKGAHGNAECSCPEEPLTEKYPDVTDRTCDYYYLCHLGRALKLKCGPQFAFHPDLKQCLPRTRIPHGICKSLVECPMRINRFVEDKKDCTKYFLCLRGSYSHWSCPENTFFEPNEEHCSNDRTQAEACVAMAKKHLYNRVGFEKGPLRTSMSLDEAKNYLKAEKERLKKKDGQRRPGPPRKSANVSRH